jgi:hypothetical protein
VFPAAVTPPAVTPVFTPAAAAPAAASVFSAHASTTEAEAQKLVNDYNNYVKQYNNLIKATTIPGCDRKAIAKLAENATPFIEQLNKKITAISVDYTMNSKHDFSSKSKHLNKMIDVLKSFNPAYWGWLGGGYKWPVAAGHHVPRGLGLVEPSARAPRCRMMVVPIERHVQTSIIIW